MATIYRVEYSETHGYYVNTQDSVEVLRHGVWVREVDDRVAGEWGDEFKSYEGWRESEAEAVAIWRADAIAAAFAYNSVAHQLEEMASGPDPKTPERRIMKPELK